MEYSVVYDQYEAQYVYGPVDLTKPTVADIPVLEEVNVASPILTEPAYFIPLMIVGAVGIGIWWLGTTTKDFLEKMAIESFDYNLGLADRATNIGDATASVMEGAGTLVGSFTDIVQGSVGVVGEVVGDVAD